MQRADGNRVDPSERQALVARLRRIQGQARAVERMISEGDTCERILHQIAAMRGALGRVGSELVACQAAGQVTGQSEEETRHLLSYWLNRLG